MILPLIMHMQSAVSPLQQYLKTNWNENVWFFTSTLNGGLPFPHVTCPRVVCLLVILERPQILPSVETNAKQHPRRTPTIPFHLAVPHTLTWIKQITAVSCNWQGWNKIKIVAIEGIHFCPRVQMYTISIWLNCIWDSTQRPESYGWHRVGPKHLKNYSEHIWRKCIELLWAAVKQSFFQAYAKQRISEGFLDFLCWPDSFGWPPLTDNTPRVV